MNKTFKNLLGITALILLVSVLIYSFLNNYEKIEDYNRKQCSDMLAQIESQPGGFSNENYGVKCCYVNPFNKHLMVLIVEPRGIVSYEDANEAKYLVMVTNQETIKK